MAVWPFKRTEEKAHPAGGALMIGGGPAWARKDKSQQYISEGYQLNVIVYRAVNEIVRAATSINVELYNGEDAVEQHPVLDLLKQPTPGGTWQTWLTEMLVNRMLLGEMAAASDNPRQPTEIWPLMPMNIAVVPGASGLARQYIYEVNRKKTVFEVDQITGQSDLLFVKTYNPSDYWRGQSPLMAAAIAGDTHNAGMRWNYSLLKNSARPSGLIRFKTGYPSGEMINRMREYFKARMQGAENAGEIPMLADDAEWQQLSQSARDMDFSNTMRETAKYVAAALGVPLPLIDNDASTFNNLEQAKERLYTDTVIPLMRDVLASLNTWLLPRYGDGLELRLDLDTIPALEALRERMFQRAVTAYREGVLTLQEARMLMGYQPEADGEFKPTPGASFDLPAEDIKALAYGLDIETKADSYAPNDGMKEEAKRGLEWRRDFNRGGTEVGVARARDISNGKNLSADTVKRMNSYFARHEVDKQGEGWSPGEPGYPSAGRIAWALWGGDAGKSWAAKIVRQMDDE
jgi:HK97 family phage portal protein